MDTCETKTKIMLHASAGGQIMTKQYSENIDPSVWNPDLFERAFEEFGDRIVGIKLRISRNVVQELGLRPLEEALRLSLIHILPFYMQGKSLASILTGQASPDYHKDSVYSEYYYCLKGTHEDIFATMRFDGRYKIVNYHNKEFGELYDLEHDPEEFVNLWDNPDYAVLKAELIKKNFDSAVMKNMDYSMNRINDY